MNNLLILKCSDENIICNMHGIKSLFQYIDDFIDLFRISEIEINVKSNELKKTIKNVEKALVGKGTMKRTNLSDFLVFKYDYNHNLLLQICQTGNLNAIKYCKRLCGNLHAFNQNMIKSVLQYGYIDCIEYFYNNPNLLKNSSENLPKKPLKILCKYGQLECIKRFYFDKYFYNSSAVYYTILFNHLDCLKFISTKQRITTNKNISCAYSIGNLQCLDYLLELKNEEQGFNEYCEIKKVKIELKNFKQNYNLDCLIKITENIVIKYNTFTLCAIIKDDVSSLIYLYAVCKSEFDLKENIQRAIMFDSIECFKFLLNFYNGMKHIYYPKIFQHDAIKCLKYLHKNGFPWLYVKEPYFEHNNRKKTYKYFEKHMKEYLVD